MSRSYSEYSGHSVSRVTKDVLGWGHLDWQAIADPYRYGWNASGSATFALDYRGKPKVLTTLHVLPDFGDVEATEFGIELEILSGACKGTYRYNRTFDCGRKLESFGKEGENLDARIAEGLHDFLRGFAQKVFYEDNSFLVRVSGGNVR